MSEDKPETEAGPEADQTATTDAAHEETVIDAEFEPVDEKSEAAEELIGKKSRPAWPLVWALIFLALIFGGAVGGLAQRYIPFLPQAPAPDAAQITDLQGQVKSLQDKLANLPAPDVDALTQRVADLENARQTTQAEPQSVDIAPVQDEIRKLADRVTSLESRPVPTADGEGATVNLQPLLDRLNALETAEPDMSLYARKTDIPAAVDLSGLQTRVQKLEAEEGQAAANAPDLSAINARLDALETLRRSADKNERQASWAQLQLAAQGAEPFTDDYTTAMKLWPDNAGLRSIAAIAETGAPTRVQLQEEFAQMIPALMKAEHAAPKDAGWLQKAGAAMGSLVSVRDTSGEGDSVDARIARTETLLAQDDLGGAIKEVTALPAKFAADTKTWLQSARARQKLDTVLAQAAPAGAGDSQEAEATP